MLGYAIRILILVVLEIIIVQCVIPSTGKLTVRKVDSKLIERKRMDTLEMCRIFENERTKHNLEPEKNYGKTRRKREIAGPKFGGVPTLREEDVKRVESIVDKLYDDLSETGKLMHYRTRKREKATTVDQKLNENVFNHSNRRFDFAPAFLLGPEPPGAKPSPPETVPVPWIKKWKHAIIPFFIDPKTYDSGLADVIMSAFDYFERATCIRLQRLREKPTDEKSMAKVEWVYISNPMGVRQCVHSNERIPNKGVQMVVFGYDCMSTGEIVHEVMHVLGFSHEHTRPDRDQHVSIMWDNIKPGYKKYFELRHEDQLLRLPYDYASVLHYPPRAFSKNGQITVSAKAGVKLGQREGLSETDVEKVALIFGNECVDRNKDYLLTTCPSVVKAKKKKKDTSQKEITDYFNDRIWSYGIVNFKFRDAMEFSAEEKENIQSVIRHIEKETCIEFRDMNEQDPEEGLAEAGEDSDENNDEDNDYPGSNGSGNGERPTNDQPPNSDELALYKESNKIQLLKDVTEKIGTTIADEDNNPTPTEETSDTTVAEGESTQKPPEETDNTPNEVAVEENKDPAGQPGPGKIVSLEVDTAAAKQNLRRNLRKKRSLNKKRKYSGKLKRRHADSVLVLTRSAEPGCKCPPPGKGQADSVLELSADCFNSVNDLLHVFVHVLGLEHQHNMHDRDEFLHIVWDKLTPEIQEEMREKLPPAAAVGFPYDYQSVMHYPWLQIKDGVTSIMYPIWNDGWAMGHWQGLSSTDVQKLNFLYFNQCFERRKQEEHAKHPEQDKKRTTSKTTTKCTGPSCKSKG